MDLDWCSVLPSWVAWFQQAVYKQVQQSRENAYNHGIATDGVQYLPGALPRYLHWLALHSLAGRMLHMGAPCAGFACRLLAQHPLGAANAAGTSQWRDVSAQCLLITALVMTCRVRSGAASTVLHRQYAVSSTPYCLKRTGQAANAGFWERRPHARLAAGCSSPHLPQAVDRACLAGTC